MVNNWLFVDYKKSSPNYENILFKTKESISADLSMAIPEKTFSIFKS